MQAKGEESVRTVTLIVAAAVLGLAIHGSVQAQPVASITLPLPGDTVQLYPGCNPVALTFPDGTTSQAVVQAVSPVGVVEAMWSFDTGLRRYEGYSAAYPQASDLLSVGYLDAVWLCLAEAPLPPPMPVFEPTAPSSWIVCNDYAVRWEHLGFGEFLVGVRNMSEKWGMCEHNVWVEVMTPDGTWDSTGLTGYYPYLEPGEVIVGSVYPQPLRSPYWTVYAVVGEWTWCQPGIQWKAELPVYFVYVASLSDGEIGSREGTPCSSLTSPPF